MKVTNHDHTLKKDGAPKRVRLFAKEHAEASAPRWIVISVSDDLIQPRKKQMGSVMLTPSGAQLAWAEMIAEENTQNATAQLPPRSGSNLKQDASGG